MSAPMGAGDRRRRWWGVVCNNNDSYHKFHGQMQEFPMERVNR